MGLRATVLTKRQCVWLGPAFALGQNLSNMPVQPIPSYRTSARVVAYASIIMFALSMFAYGAVFAPLLEEPISTQHIEGLKANPTFYATGLLAFLLVLVCDVLTAWGLYHWLRPVLPALAQLSAWVRLVSVAIFATAQLALVQGWRLVSAASPAEALVAPMQQHMQTFADGWAVALFGFGGHLLLVGWLVARSGTLPRWLGFVLMVAGAAYSTDSLVKLFLPHLASLGLALNGTVTVTAIVGEVGLAIFLLVRGSRGPAIGAAG